MTKNGCLCYVMTFKVQFHLVFVLPQSFYCSQKYLLWLLYRSIYVAIVSFDNELYYITKRPTLTYTFKTI